MMTSWKFLEYGNSLNGYFSVIYPLNPDNLRMECYAKESALSKRIKPICLFQNTTQVSPNILRIHRQLLSHLPLIKPSLRLFHCAIVHPVTLYSMNSLNCVCYERNWRRKYDEPATKSYFHLTRKPEAHKNFCLIWTFSAWILGELWVVWQ